MANWKKVVTRTVGTVVPVAVGYGLYKLATGDTSSKAKDSSSGSSSGISSSGGDGSGTGSGTGSGDGTTKTKQVIEEVPIDNYEEAERFAEGEWNKIRRDDGRQLDCQVLGSPKWKVGEWCKVLLPTMDINDYMYITRVSQTSTGGDWTCTLTLVDFPPGWGKEVIELNNDEEEAEEEEDEDTESEE